MASEEEVEPGRLYLTDDALVVERGGRRQVFGRWDRDFAYRETVEPGGGLRPRIPFVWMLWGKLNMPFWPCWHELKGIPLTFHEETALLDYVEIIPERVQWLAGHFGGEQWIALDAMRHVPGFADFIGQELRGAGLSYLIAGWALSRIYAKSRMERIRINETLMTRKRDEAYEALTDAPMPRVFVEAIGKLTDGYVEEESFWRLRDFAMTEAGARALRLVRKPAMAGLMLIRGLPSWLHVDQVVGALEGVRDGRAFAHIVPRRVRNAPKGFRARMLQSLRDVGDAKTLAKRLEDWDWRLNLMAPYPPPPIPGNALLTPIVNGVALVREGKEMRHCVGNFHPDAATGFQYYYRWLGDERMTVELVWHEYGEWRFSQCLGYRNAEPSAKTLAAVLALVEEQLAKHGKAIVTFHVAGTRYYRARQVAGDLRPGDPLVLRREPNNPHDRRAVEVLTVDGAKLGYVPRFHNPEIVPEMDRALAMEARVVDVSGDIVPMIAAAVFEGPATAAVA